MFISYLVQCGVVTLKTICVEYTSRYEPGLDVKRGKPNDSIFLKHHQFSRNQYLHYSGSMMASVYHYLPFVLHDIMRSRLVTPMKCTSQDPLMVINEMAVLKHNIHGLYYKHSPSLTRSTLFKDPCRNCAQ